MSMMEETRSMRRHANPLVDMVAAKVRNRIAEVLREHRAERDRDLAKVRLALPAQGPMTRSPVEWAD